MESSDPRTEKTTTAPETTAGDSFSVDTQRPSSRHSIFGYSWKSRFVVFATTIGVLGIALGMAFLISELSNIPFKTTIVIALIISFPITQYLLARLLIRKKSSH